MTNVHAPTNEKREEIKEEFYNVSVQNINEIANSDIKILLGDLNQMLVKKIFTNPLLEMKFDVMKPTTTE